MAINPNDDYKKLAKLLYPSIEASGNVYYGQTKKLTMDEVLGKNELNFDSHIESFREEDESYDDGLRYDSYFCWKIGPLRGSVRANIPYNTGGTFNELYTFPDVDKIWVIENGDASLQDLSVDFSKNGTAFAKYRLDFNNIRTDNITGAGQFPTYESNVDLVFEGICVTDEYGPVPERDKINDNLVPFDENRNFFVDNKNNLYIKVCRGIISVHANDKYLPLTITLKNDKSAKIRLVFDTEDGDAIDSEAITDSFEYEYLDSYSNEWQNCIFSVDSVYSSKLISNDIILSHNKDYVQFKCKKYKPNGISLRVRIECVSNGEGNPKVSTSYNALSMLDGNPTKFAVMDDISDYEMALFGLFSDMPLTDASKLILQATTLSYGCYSWMFSGCTSLTAPPKLSATNLADACYCGMFSRCTLLTSASLLPNVTELKYGCYSSMFQGCENLTRAPVLSATTLADYCYADMFFGCTNLTHAPELPATTLAEYCYNNMFHGCSSLVQAPELPATTLASNCYNGMFSGCTSLIIAPELRAKHPVDACYANMFNGCSSLTELYCDTLVGDMAGGFDGWLDGTADGLKMFIHTNQGNSLPIPSSATPSDNRWFILYDDYFIIMALDDSEDISLSIGEPAGSTYEYSVNSFSNFTSYTDETLLSLNKGNFVLFKCTSKQRTHVNGNFPASDRFLFDNGAVCILGNVSQLVANNAISEFEFLTMFREAVNLSYVGKKLLPATELAPYCYAGMFEYCSSLEIAPELPATELADGCYKDMFHSCSLKIAPKLPAITLADNCYEEMFHFCGELEQSPELPATELAPYCYAGMFSWCENLTQAPELPATTLANNCYEEMFNYCVSLTQAPELPATTLANNCYEEMFNYCVSLTQAPELPATELAPYCYAWMFSRCENLTEIHCSVGYIDSSSYFNGWLSGNTNSGILYVRDIAVDGWNDHRDIILPDRWVLKTNINGPNSFNSKLDCIDSENKYKQAYLVTSGTDSDINGRGKLNNSTLFNMESTFDESNTHKVDEYNNDGSLNQEIWGYKTFNSPVKFRNGIYGDGFSFVSCDPTVYNTLGFMSSSNVTNKSGIALSSWYAYTYNDTNNKVSNYLAFGYTASYDNSLVKASAKLCASYISGSTVNEAYVMPCVSSNNNGDVYIKTLGSIVPSSSNVDCIGTSELKYNEVNATSANVTTVNATTVNATTVNVGASGNVVTTHNSSDDTLGDNQTILGEKQFSNTIKTNKILPISSNCDIGSSSYSFKTAYINNIEYYTNDVSDAVKITSKNVYVVSKPDNADYPKAQIRTHAYVNNNITEVSITFYVDDDNNKKYTLMYEGIGNSRASLYPANTNGGPVDLGRDNCRFGVVYASEIKGLIQTAASGYSSQPEIGSIFLAYLTATTHTSAKAVGVDVNTSEYTIQKASLALGTGGVITVSAESPSYISTGVYRLMSAINSLLTGNSAVALVICVG